MLQIIINSDHNLHLDGNAKQQIEADLGRRLGRFEEDLTREVVHLADENAQKTNGQDDKRCMLEARPERMNAINVTHRAASVDEAIHLATKKLERLLDNTFEKRNDHRS